MNKGTETTGEMFGLREMHLSAVLLNRPLFTACCRKAFIRILSLAVRHEIDSYFEMQGVQPQGEHQTCESNQTKPGYTVYSTFEVDSADGGTLRHAIHPGVEHTLRHLKWQL
jgi:hypothetical protein